MSRLRMSIPRPIQKFFNFDISHRNHQPSLEFKDYELTLKVHLLTLVILYLSAYVTIQQLGIGFATGVFDVCSDRFVIKS